MPSKKQSKDHGGTNPVVDKPRIEAAVREILLAVGENPDREGLLETPGRVARMYEEIFSGLRENPRIHMSKTFNEKYQLPIESTPKEITAFVRARLREKYQRADAGITGGNFLIADTGSVALTENEGNALMSIAFPKVHIAIVGIEKIIPSLEDLDLFWPLLATHGTGQNITVYNSILSGPSASGEIDGPEEMYVVLLDNGRTQLLGQPDQRQALYCIRCGACLNGCPIYKGVGGQIGRAHV